jgi:hypothetical protein
MSDLSINVCQNSIIGEGCRFPYFSLEPKCWNVEASH